MSSMDYDYVSTGCRMLVWNKTAVCDCPCAICELLAVGQSSTLPHARVLARTPWHGMRNYRSLLLLRAHIGDKLLQQEYLFI